jgi:hypothetical protein
MTEALANEATVTWSGGGDASVVSLDPSGIVLRSTVPSPPGSRIEGALGGHPLARLCVKVHGCKRQDDGAFELRGRPIDMTREVRERIEGLLRPLETS